MTDSPMRPFFPFFGSKWREVPRYPAPEHDLIVEPFAGSACYATRHPDRKVLLIDRDPVVVAVWRYLIRVKAGEVLTLPDVREHVSELEHLPQECRWLAGFWLNKGSSTPKSQPSAWMRRGDRMNSFWGAAVRQRIASQVDRIRHWQVREGLYDSAPAVRATWFVDPPYHGPAGRRYRGGHRGLNYPQIGRWCQRQRGLVIVCEQAGADWLPFRPHRRIKANHATAWSDEVVWVRREPKQLELIGAA